MGNRAASLVCGLALLLATACAGPPKPARTPDPPWHPATAILLPYSAPDGSLTRAQLEAGLHRDFEKLDANHSGCLDQNEVRAINAQRWKADASTTSPLIDFKNNGCIDFDEFAAEPRSLFDLLDRDGKGKLTAQQLNPGSQPSTQQGQGSDTGRGHQHRGGNGGENPSGS